MPPVRYSTGNGSTASLGAQAGVGKVNGARNVSPNSPWTYRTISDYNRATYSDMPSANERNAFLIRQAQRQAAIAAQQRRAEEARRLAEMERQQALQEQNRSIIASQASTQIPLSSTPFAGASRPAIINYLGPQGPEALSNLTSGPNMTPTSAFKDLATKALGIASAQVATANSEAVSRIMADSQANIAKTKQLTSPTIYEEINMLENTYDERVAQAAVEIWGRPRELTYYNPDTGQVEFGGWDWAYDPESSAAPVPGSVEAWRQKLTGEAPAQGFGRPVEYLGLERGQVPAPRPAAPDADAPYSEWARYRDELQQSVRKPKYMPESVMETLWAMGPEGVKQMQKQMLKAQWYDTNDFVKLGVIGPKEIAWMKDLMSYANINGMTWEQQFELELRASAEAAARAGSGGGGYGGGGGGGGGTTVYKQIQYTQTSLAQGRSLLVGILREALGREPTDTEVAKFMSILNKAESKSPTKTVTKTTTEGDMTRAVSRTTPSGVDPEAMAEEFAQSIRGGKPYEANAQARYLTALLESLGRPRV